MTSDTSIGFIIFYVLFTGFLLLVAPYFAYETGLNENAVIGTVDTNNPLYAFSLMNSILSIGFLVTTNPIFAIIFLAIQVGFLVSMVDVLWLG